MRRVAIAVMIAAAYIAPAFGHREWLDGTTVDKKTQSLCCGADKDCFRLDPSHVHLLADGLYHFDDTPFTIDEKRAMPSPDGAYWRCIWGGEIRCLFVPFEGT